MTESLGSRARRRGPRRTPAIATTLVAAALAGELVAGTLAPTEALAQTDESAPTEAHAQSDEAPPGDGSSEPAPEPEPEPALPPPAADVGAPPVQAPPVESPPASAAPEAGIPVRTGYAPDAASEVSLGAMDEGAPAASPRVGSDRDAAPATSRTGRRAAAHRAPEGRASGAPARDGRRAAPRRHSTRDATNHRRASRPRAPHDDADAGASAGPRPNEHTVVAGEHLWGIAAARLAELTGRDLSSLTAEEIAPYWTRLCMVNAHRLRSGDLNLVHPGEVIELPLM